MKLKRSWILVVLVFISAGAGADQLHPDFPVVSGNYQMTRQWSLQLPGKFNRRVEDGSLVLWRPGFTIWVDAREYEPALAPEARVAWIRTLVSSEAFDIQERSQKEHVLLSYRLRESAGDSRVPALYGFVVSAQGYVSLAMYFDNENDVGIAMRLLESVSQADVLTN